MTYENLRDQVKNINRSIKEKYSEIFSMENLEFRNLIIDKVGQILDLEKMKEDQLKNFGKLITVDGSVNRAGGNYPHYIELYRGLGLGTDNSRLIKNMVYTPILSEEKNQNEDKSKKLLAEIELETAREAVEKFKPQILMMDGGLVRYYIYGKEKLELLISTARENNTEVFGLIKDIKTDIISKALKFSKDFYDREILFGRLKVGEGIFIKNTVNEKFKDYGFSSCFLRTSNYPGAVGIDLVDGTEEKLKKIANLVYTLTPKDSRGVPLLIDIVDKEVKITDDILNKILESELDRQYYERFFISERDKRN